MRKNNENRWYSRTLVKAAKVLLVVFVLYAAVEKLPVLQAVATEDNVQNGNIENTVSGNDRQDDNENTVSSNNGQNIANQKTGIMLMSLADGITPLNSGGTAGKDDITVTISGINEEKYTCNADGNITLSNLKVSFAVADGCLVKDSYTLTFPDYFTANAGAGVSGNITANGNVNIGSVYLYSTYIKLDFTQLENGSSVDGDATRTVYNNIIANVTADFTLDPENNSGTQPISCGYSDSDGGTDDDWAVDTVHYNPVEKELKVSQNISESGGGSYSSTIWVTPGNVAEQRPNSVVIQQELKNLSADSAGSITVTVNHAGGGTETLTKDQDYTITTVPGTSSGDSVDTSQIVQITLNNFDAKDNNGNYIWGEDDTIEITYPLTENSDIYGQTDPATLSAGTGVYASDGDTNAIATANPYNKTVTPKPISCGYEVVKDGNKEILKWTIALNNDEITMYNPKLAVEVVDADKGYLELLNTSHQIESTTNGGLSWTMTGSASDIANDKFGYGYGTGATNATLEKANTVTFYTAITDEFYQSEKAGTNYQFHVNYQLTWDTASDGSGKTMSTKADQGALDNNPAYSNSVIKKSAEPKSSDGTIVWTFTVNGPGLTLSAYSDGSDTVKLTDTMPECVEDVTEVVADGVNKFNDNSFWSYNTTSRELVIYVPLSDLTTGTGTSTVGKSVEIKVTTELSDEVVYQNGTTSNIKNDAVLYYNGANSSKAGTTTYYTSSLLSTGSGYDKAKQQVTWTMDLNQSDMNLGRTTLTAAIPEGLTVSQDSLERLQNDGYNPSVTDGTLTITCSGLSAYKQIKFSTDVTDTSKFYDASSTHNLEMPVTLTNNSFPANSDGEKAIKKEAKVSIPVSVITKTPGTMNKFYSTWKITVNDDYQDMRGDAGSGASAVITDTYTVSDGVDTSVSPADMTLKVYFKGNTNLGSPDDTLTVLPSGSGTAGQDALVTVDQESKKFSVSLPILKSDDYASAMYVLEYRIKTANIADSVSTITVSNEAVFDCNRGRGVTEQSSGTKSNSVNVGSAGGSAGQGDAYVDKTKCIVTKTDADTGELLEGVTFGLYSIYGLEETAVTDANGQAVFYLTQNDALGYYIKELKAAEGYELSADEIALENVESNNEITKTLSNTKKKADITFTKVSDSGIVLSGAEFALYGAGDNIDATAPKQTAVSDENGVVTFADVTYGNYVIWETAAPAGHILADAAIAVAMTDSEDGVTVTLSGGGYREADNTVVNQSKAASVTVQLQKVDEDMTSVGSSESITGNNSEGVTYTLKSRTGSWSRSITVTADTDELVFEDVPYGEYALYKDGVELYQKALEYDDLTESDILLMDLDEEKAGAHITVDDNGDLQDSTFTIYYRDAPQKVAVTVVDKKDNRVLANSRVGLYLRSGSGAWKLYRTGYSNTDGQVSWWIPNGEYQIMQLDFEGSAVPGVLYAADTETEGLFEFAAEDGELTMADGAVYESGHQFTRQMLEEWENRLVLLEDIAVNMEEETEAGADISSDTASDFGASSDPEEAEQDGEMIAVLTIDAIDLSVPVLKDATAANLKRSVATIEPTGIPGEIGNFAVAGHNSRTFGRHFNRLDEVELGDLIEVEVRNATYRYMVDHIQVIEAEDVWILESDNQTARITLISCCYAEDGTVKRLAVQGTLVE